MRELVSIPDYKSYENAAVSGVLFDLMRCGSCGHCFPRQRLGRKELTAIYASGEYVAMKTYRDPANEDRLARIARIFVEDVGRHVARKDGAALFEVGASFGHLLEAAREAGFRVSGIEPSVEAAAYARETKGLAVENATVESAQLDGASFDAIVAISVLEHVYDLEETAAKLKGALSPEGLFYVEVPTFDSIAVRLKGKRYIRSSVARGEGIFHPVEHVRYFTVGSLGRWLSRHFERVEALPDPRWGRFYPAKWSTRILSRVLNASPTGNIVFAASRPKV